MLWSRARVDVLNHWIAFADGFNMPSSDFYKELEAKLKETQIPEMVGARVDFAEGGLLSDKRTYLRFEREDIVFDICACPFGRGFFFSCRTAKIPIPLWEFFLFFFLAAVGSLYCFAKLGLIGGAFAILALFAVAFAYTRTRGSLDSVLMRTPLVRAGYVIIRPETYYREDSRLMYLDKIVRLVKATAEEVTAEKGLKLVREYIHAPILGSLYRPVYNDLLVVQRAEDVLSGNGNSSPAVGL